MEDWGSWCVWAGLESANLRRTQTRVVQGQTATFTITVVVISGVPQLVESDTSAQLVRIDGPEPSYTGCLSYGQNGNLGLNGGQTYEAYAPYTTTLTVDTGCYGHNVPAGIYSLNIYGRGGTHTYIVSITLLVYSQ